MKKNQTVVVLGASAKPERYSNQAVLMLKENGCKTIPVNPTGVEIHGLTSTKKLEDIKESIDTLTLYVNPKISSALEATILALAPGRVIFNPGTENPELEEILNKNEIETVRACTLVMLRTGQF